jgi:hypothetical protein
MDKEWTCKVNNKNTARLTIYNTAYYIKLNKREMLNYFKSNRTTGNLGLPGRIQFFVEAHLGLDHTIGCNV